MLRHLRLSPRPPGYRLSTTSSRNRHSPLVCCCSLQPKKVIIGHENLDEDMEVSVDFVECEVRDQIDYEEILSRAGCIGLIAQGTKKHITLFDDLESGGIYMIDPSLARAVKTVQGAQKNAVHASEDAAGKCLKSAIELCYTGPVEDVKRTVEDVKGRKLGESDSIFLVGKMIFYMFHKSVMTTYKLEKAVKKVQGFVKLVQKEQREPFVGKCFVMVAAADLLVEGEDEDEGVIEACKQRGIPLIVRSGAEYILEPSAVSVANPTYVSV